MNGGGFPAVAGWLDAVRWIRTRRRTLPVGAFWHVPRSGKAGRHQERQGFSARGGQTASKPIRAPSLRLCFFWRSDSGRNQRSGQEPIDPTNQSMLTG